LDVVRSGGGGKVPDVPVEAIEDRAGSDGLPAVEVLCLLQGGCYRLLSFGFRGDEPFVAGGALVEEVGGVVGEGFDGQEPEFHLAEVVSYDGEVGEGGVVAAAVGEEPGGLVQEAVVEAERDGGEVGASDDDRADMGGGQAVAAVAEEVVGGHAYAVQGEGAGGEAVQADPGGSVRVMPGRSASTRNALRLRW
jgi:hypothetical protein